VAGVPSEARRGPGARRAVGALPVRGACSPRLRRPGPVV